MLSTISIRCPPVSQLLVRELDEAVVAALKAAAARHGRSAEAEHREILKLHLLAQPQRRSFKDVLKDMPYFDDDALFDVR
jgi:plasmid stability protein